MSDGSQPAQESAPTRKWWRRGLLAAIGVLYVFSVPWYRDVDAPLRIVFGVPDWVAVAIGCYAAAACLNAVAWLLEDSSDAPRPAVPNVGSEDPRS